MKQKKILEIKWDGGKWVVIFKLDTINLKFIKDEWSLRC